MFNGAGYPGGTAMLPGPTRRSSPPGRTAAPPRRTRGSPWRSPSCWSRALAGGWFGGRALLAVERPVDAAKGATMTYGKGGDIPEFAVEQRHVRDRSRSSAGGSYPSDGDPPATSPHDFEVLRLRRPGCRRDLDYPGRPAQDARRGVVRHACSAPTSSVEPTRDELAYATLYPTEQWWDEQAENTSSSSGGDRSVYCLITSRDPNQQLQGPAAEPGAELPARNVGGMSVSTDERAALCDLFTSWGRTSRRCAGAGRPGTSPRTSSCASAGPTRRPASC